MFGIARTVTVLAATLPFLGVLGCGKILGIPSDPHTTGGGAGSGSAAAALPDNWSCVAEGPQALEVADETEVRVRICDYGTTCSTTSATALTATVCNKLDCSVPVLEDVESKDGNFAFDLDLEGYDEGFDGYLRISDNEYAHCQDEEAFGELADGSLCEVAGCPDPDAADCVLPVHIPTLYALTPPVTGYDSIERYVDLIRVESAYTILDYAGATLEDGNVFMLEALVLDCNGQPASGVELSASVDGYYLAYERDGVFINEASTTSSTGVAAFFNLPPRYVVLTAKVNGVTVSTEAVTLEQRTASFVTMHAESAD